MENTKEPIRVAQVMGKMNSGGVEAFVMNYYRHIDRNKIQFDFIVDNDSSIPQREEIERLGGNIIEVPSYEHIFKYIRKLTEIFKKRKYKIVHSHLNTLSIFPLFCAYISGVPNRIAHSHSTSNKREVIKNILKKFLKPFSKIFATQYFACSEYAGRWLFGNKTFENRKVEIIKNAIDIEKFKYNEQTRKDVRKKLDIENKFVLGHVGRFMKQKNHEFLIDIFYELQKEKDNLVLILIGEGPLADKIRKKVSDLRIEKKVIFLGSQSDVYKYMQAMDLFVFPSLYEGLGIVLIEAQCSGLSCFCSKDIPEDVNVTDNVKFINNNSLQEWKKEITGYQSIDREKEYIEKIRNSGYDIKISNLQLQEAYLNMIIKDD